MEWVPQFSHLWALYLLIPTVLLMAFLHTRLSHCIKYLYPLASTIYSHGFRAPALRRRVFTWLRILLLLVLVILIAKPQWVDTKSQMDIEGIDIILALDVSGSMHNPNHQTDPRRRIDVAKEEALRFIDKRENDAIGLVLFGNDALSRCPLTSDKRILHEIINETDIGVVPYDGTVISKALLTAINRLRYSKAKSKIIILLTDGEPTPQDVNPDLAIKAAQQVGVKIYTVGIGDNQDVIHHHPVYGPMIMSARINAPLLTKFAHETGGTFFMAKEPQDMRRIYNTIDTLEKTKIQVPIFTRVYDWFLPLVWLALACILSEVILSSFIWFGL
jgi:Ca-activated chloride channel family protein